MATKAQEREALAKIKKIVDDLGEESYIGFALEGMLDDAEYNIENDCALSWCNRAQATETELAEANDTIKCRDAELADKQKEIMELRKTIEQRESYVSELLDRLHKTEDEASKIIDERMEYSTKCEQQEDEILRLKAKLYDLICK